MNIKHLLCPVLLAFMPAAAAWGQTEEPEVYTLGGLMDDIAIESDSVSADTPSTIGIDAILPPDTLAADSLSFEELLLIEQEKLKYPLVIDTSIDVSDHKLLPLFFMPVVYKPYTVGLYDTTRITTTDKHRDPMLPAGRWVNVETERHNELETRLQQFCADYPWVVRLNLQSLPEPPKKYVATVDPSTESIKVSEVVVDLDEANKGVGSVYVKPKNWLHRFEGTLHFSQAYNSPNWYQGGNNNLNLIGNFVWNVKLNQAYHPNLLFENTVQYKLAMNNAPDDSLRNYSISEDRFQVNTNFGLKASNHWYYSVTMQFKTQLLQNHPINRRSTTVSFLSPAELNIGLGMTYERTSRNKKATVKLSLAPLSYNMISFRDTKVTNYSGKKVRNQYGSNIEAKLSWRPVYNISYQSRLFTFTNYEYVQGDWENTISFDINRFLTTQIFIHLRYDSRAKEIEDSKWHRWMLKEILSFGFTYKFSSL